MRIEQPTPSDGSPSGTRIWYVDIASTLQIANLSRNRPKTRSAGGTLRPQAFDA
jgi:hypothetical protein